MLGFILGLMTFLGDCFLILALVVAVFRRARSPLLCMLLIIAKFGFLFFICWLYLAVLELPALDFAVGGLSGAGIFIAALCLPIVREFLQHSLDG